MNEQDKETTSASSVSEYLGVRSPKDVKAMRDKEIPALCQRLRRVLIERTLQNGGHLASNLGVVELTVAIHRVFDAPIDHIVFDVGHQAYVHKLLTGRADAFDTLRMPGGISGFPRRDESEYDAFGTGHASTSLSAALGLARAARLRGSDAYTVVVLGDGALTGGMIHEALNNCDKELKLIIILNENEMSISKNVGQFARLLTRLRTASGYLNTKSALERTLEHLPVVGKPVRQGLSQVKKGIKRVLYSNNYFEYMGLNYFGPADGNDERMVEQLLRSAKAKRGCSIIHLKTVKGKGYEPAEKSPSDFHGLPAAGGATNAPTFSRVFGETLTQLAGENDRLCAITAAMPQGTGLAPFAKAHPERFFDVGIAEEHAVTFAAGLAAGGYTPVVAIYSTFLQRSYDQILHDVALQRLPVLFAIDRAGFNAADGLTHQGIFDVAFLSDVPGMEIIAPLTTDSLRAHMQRLLSAPLDHSVAIRYPSGADDDALVDFYGRVTEQAAGVFTDFDAEQPPETVVVTYGRLTSAVLTAAGQCEKRAGVVLLERLRPYGAIVEHLSLLTDRGVKKIIFCEEGILSGGEGMNLAHALRSHRAGRTLPDLRILAVQADEAIPEPGVGQSTWDAAHIGVLDIKEAIEQ